VGDNLGVTLDVVFAMSASELATWLSYYAWKAKEEKKASEKAQAKARARRGRR